MADEKLDNETQDEATALEASEAEVVEEPVAEAEAVVEAEPVAEAEAEPAEAEAEPAEAEAEPIEAEAEQVAEVEADEPIAEAAAEAEPAPAEATVDAEAEPAAEVEAEEAPAEAAAPARKKKKRLPRALRPERTKPKREKPAGRKPITRLPKPEHARGRRQERLGSVVSAAGDKTIVVRVDTVKSHPMYKKVIRRSTRLHAHDELNEAKVGDIVRVVETRPLSRLKRWRLQEIVEAAK
jgi:small subunit ribosomal protein S17